MICTLFMGVAIGASCTQSEDEAAMTEATLLQAPEKITVGTDAVETRATYDDAAIKFTWEGDEELKLNSYDLSDNLLGTVTYEYSTGDPYGTFKLKVGEGTIPAGAAYDLYYENVETTISGNENPEFTFKARSPKFATLATIDNQTLKWETSIMKLALTGIPAIGNVQKVTLQAADATKSCAETLTAATPFAISGNALTLYVGFDPSSFSITNGVFRVILRGTAGTADAEQQGFTKTFSPQMRYTAPFPKPEERPWKTAFVTNNTIWAESNVEGDGTDDDGGKFATNSYDYGSFYQWNRNKAWGNGDWDFTTPTGTDWNNDKGPCPPGWRLPTTEEFTALKNLSTKGWKTESLGINGYEFTDAGGNTLFLPAAGQHLGSAMFNQGTYGNYWSAAHYGLVHDYSGILFISSGGVSTSSSYRKYGLSVRCVMN
jgi:uncharacterized protein (TIGR02145 family)